ncbi:MAG: hypothetical protein OXT65_06555 [Alphaproteobacteria bacterium]|nr:hypothetical protein [Alphaproteobacteria bacterium]
MAQQKRPAGAGRFEVTQAKFADIQSKQKGAAQALDLKEALPDVLQGNATRLPRLVDRVWRRSCDEIISENRGVYTYKGGTKVDVFFYEVTPAVAKAKVSLIKMRIPKILKEAQGNEAVLDAPLVSAKQQTTTSASQSAGTSKLQKEGLPENPPLETLHLWADRAYQDMMASTGSMPMTRDMMDLAMKADVTYLPLWNPPSGMIVGSFCTPRSPIPMGQQTPGEPLRQDLAALFHAVFQIYSIISKGAHTIIITPVRTSTLTDKRASELYTGLIRRISPEARKCLICNVVDVPKEAASITLSSAIDLLTQQVRACIFETGILTQANYLKQFPKLHACGFDSADALLSEHEQVGLMKKFTDHYHGAGIKCFVRNISSAYVLDAAIEGDCAYISGPIVKPSQKTAFPMSKYTVEDVPGTQ